MSQLLAPEQTLVDSIPLGRRLREIMKEKGSKYSLTAVSNRLGISRETLRLMLSGGREIYRFELEKLAQDLKVPVERILQEDILDTAQELKRLGACLEEQDRALILAKELEKTAIGPSEKAHVFGSIGMIYFWQEKLDQAESCFAAMYELVKQATEKEEDQEMEYIALKNLVYVYAYRKQSDKVLQIIASAEHIFAANSSRLGVMYYSLATAMDAMQKKAEAKMYSYKSLEHILVSERDEIIGRAYLNVSFYEFSDMQYGKAKEHLQKALQYQLSDRFRLFITKDLAKVMVKLKENQAAEELIRAALQDEAIEQNLEIKAQLLILLSRAKDTHRYAEAVAGNLQYEKKMRYLASRFLRVYFKRLRLRGHLNKKIIRVAGTARRKYPLDRTF